MDINKDNTPGYDEEELASTKIAPLDSPEKSHVGHEHTHGVIGEDYILQSSHIDPFHGSDNHGASQQGGHHILHRQRRDQQQRQDQKQVKGGKAATTEEGHHEGSKELGMKSEQRMGEEVADDTKGGKPMREE